MAWASEKLGGPLTVLRMAMATDGLGDQLWHDMSSSKKYFLGRVLNCDETTEGEGSLVPRHLNG